MSEYHVACGMAGIYAGTLKSNGNEWKNKTLVTDEALEAVRDWLYSEFIKDEKTSGGYSWTRKDGREVSLIIKVDKAKQQVQKEDE